MYKDLLAELLDSQLAKEKSNESVNNNLGDSDGFVSIKNGIVVVKDPVGNGRLPSITPCEGLKLFINGTVLHQTVFVNEVDVINIETLDQEQHGGFDVVISEDELSASITLKVYYLIKHTLKDNQPEVSVSLSTERNYLNKGWDFTLEQVKEQLKKENVVFGLGFDVLQSEFETGEETTFIVAKGIPPTESKDEVVEILFSSESDLGINKFKLNPRDHGNVFSVDKGYILAVKHKGSAGKPGTTVTGKSILPQEPQTVTLKGDEGVEIIDDGYRAIAKISGGPKVQSTEKLFKFSVDPLLIHKGNVNLSTGNIKFKGNVKIIGNVEDYSTVDATETVNIFGNVDNSKVFAGKHINVKEKVIAGILRAGGIGAYCGRLLPLLKNLLKTFEDMQNAIQQLIQNTISSGMKLDDNFFGRLIFLLKEKKFNYLDKDIQKFIDMVLEAEVQVPEDILSLAERFKTEFLAMNSLRIEDIKVFYSIKEELMLAKSIAQSLKEQKSNVMVDYAQNSRISASGDVIVSGQGCFTTVIYSGGNTKINGVFRGGQIYADGNVFIDELGTEAGNITRIVVPSNKTISINMAHEDVHIRMGPIGYRFSQAMMNVLLKLDKRGKLVLKGTPISSEEDKEVVPKGLSIYSDSHI